MRTFRSAWHTSLACVHLWKLNLRCLAGANRRVCGMGSPHREWCRRRGLRTIGDGKLSAAVASVTAGEPTPSQNHIMSSSLWPVLSTPSRLFPPSNPLLPHQLAFSFTSPLPCICTFLAPNEETFVFLMFQAYLFRRNLGRVVWHRCRDSEFGLSVGLTTQTLRVVLRLGIRTLCLCLRTPRSSAHSSFVME